MGSMLTTQHAASAAGLMPFHFDGAQIRVVTDDDGSPWFVAQDVCTVLAVGTEQTRRLDDDERGLRTVQTPGGTQEMVAINESGLYSLVLTSRKPQARAFKKWITSEVLPEIRRTGSYSVSPALPRTFAEALRLAADQQDVIAAQAEQIAAAAPAVEFVDRYVHASSGSKRFREVCKVLKVKENAFWDFLEATKVMYRLRKRQTPYQNHVDAGRFEIVAGVTEEGHAFNTIYFTPKGIAWIAGELAKWQLRQHEGAAHA